MATIDLCQRVLVIARNSHHQCGITRLSEIYCHGSFSERGGFWMQTRARHVVSARIRPSRQGPSGPRQSGEQGPERPPAERRTRARAAPGRAENKGRSGPGRAENQGAGNNGDQRIGGFAMSNVTPTVATRPSNVRAIVPLAVGAAVT